MQDEEFTPTQVRRGIVITAGFIFLRLIAVRLLKNLFGSVDFQVSLKFTLFLFTVFLVMSVGLIYLGFTKWVGIDLSKWWFKRKRIRGDIGWGLVGLIFAGIIFIVSVVVAFVLLGLRPEALEAEKSQLPPLHLVPVWLILHLFFGFAIAAFQEETLFRGFWQIIFTERFGNWPGNILQAALFSLAHIGLEPLDSLSMFLFLLLLRFGMGIVFGWLKMKRQTLLAPAIAHGIIG